MTTPSRALVLSGGGNAGAAWIAGIISELQQQGAGLGNADLIVGTSAGARVGAQFATGVLGQAVGTYCRSGMPAVTAYATLPQFVAASMRIIAEAPDRQEAARRIAAMGPLGGRLASGTERRRVVAAQLPVHEWPRQRLLVAAVDAESGRRVTFGAGSGAGLVDAVMASGALPGIYPLVAINGRRYADGGVHSLYSADLAAGYDVVAVFSPVPLSDYLQATLDAEIKALCPAAVVVLADEAVAGGVSRRAVRHGGAGGSGSSSGQARQEITALQAMALADTPGRLTLARPRQP